jgi:hypothetical protein
MKDFVIGVDPGRNGGIVGLTNGKINTISKMPYNFLDMKGYFTDDLGIPIMDKEKVHVFIEAVHSRPTDGVRAAWTFGYHLGQLDGVLDMLNININRVRPTEWMGYFELKRDREAETKYFWKKRIMEFAKDQTTKANAELITLDTADAFLIALYGYHKLKSKEE